MIRFALALIVFALPLRAEVDIQQIETPGGLTAWLVQDHAIPFVALEITFEGGTSLDRPGKRGAANLMTGLIEEGAGDMDAQAFQAAREALAAQFGFDVGDDRMSVSAKMLTENRDEAAALLKLALTTPRFDQDAIDRVRGQVETGIRSAAKNPRRIASNRMNELIYGDHPYGSDDNGTLDSVAALTRADIVQSHRDLLTRDDVLISAVGDITPAALAALVDDLLGPLPQTGPAALGDADVTLDGALHVVDFPSPQATAIWVQPGLDRDDPDFFAAFVLNTILGGSGPQSRLMEEVREKRGLTYGVYSYLANKSGADIWLGSLASGNDTMADALQVVRDEWQGIADNGVTQAELDAAKTYLTGAYPLRFDGNGPIAGILAGMQIMGLPPEYIQTRNDQVNAVTLEQVNALARRMIDELTVVVVGQPQGL